MVLVRGIIDTAQAPLLTDLAVSYTDPTALSATYTGAGSLTAYLGAVVPYALIWSVYTYPASAGLASRATTVFELPWLSLAASYPLVGSSNWQEGHELIHDSNGIYWFRGGLPQSVQYSILDGWVAQFAWVVAP